ncbi:hypothetical protein [Mesoterricola sediminis]|uniref:Uncharacterized protein n=1 Tax=Mesoterricola sediminis TaxID=2927980 RepID=A0AA48GS82_9BACT|nr:hypothetical protein [Mesoterricola sediminis]BDU76674.1 hypothetical protein METESE_16320 [Mesoterricola sediminis]
MSAARLGTKQASMVWLEPHRVHAGGHARALRGDLTPDVLAMALEGLPAGPTHWVVDDAWIPSILLRDIVEVPAGAEARDAFFKWRFAQTLALEAPQSVQALDLGEQAWLLAGVAEATRESWIQTSMTLGRPMRRLVPRWLWLYNRLAPTREVPGMLLSLCPDGNGGYTGSLAAWGRNLALLRQWADPAPPEVWIQERVLPSAAYLQRESRPPQELVVWGAPAWPEGPVPARILPPDIPAQEAL